VEAALAAYPEARVTVTSDDGGAVPVDTGLALTLVGGDRALLEERDRLARDVMSANPWLRDVRSSLEGSVAERVFVVSNAALAGTGLTTSEVASTLRAYNVGVRAGDLREAGEETPIIVRVNPASIADEQTLLSLPIFAPALRSYLPLGVLGRFELQPAPVSVNRANQAYVATVSADVAEGSPGQFQLRSQVEAAFAEAGVTDEFVRVTTGIGPDLLGDLVFYGPIAFALALLLNYLVIASQFNSLRYPLYLLLTVPLALVGALWLFFLTGSPLDVISVLGVVILIGLVTKNAILLLDVVVGQLQAGETLRDALVRAGRLRLRPILMTALTVVVISIPLLVGLGEGNEFRRPLGLVILGGVVSSTFLTLFVVPAAFYRFERRRYELRGAGAEQAGEALEAAMDAPAAPPPPPLPPRAPTVEPHRHGLERPAAPATATSD
jgi:hydrophobic/amphiphilic exporter-1 (mainly G- bacteria), HAE1 family